MRDWHGDPGDAAGLPMLGIRGGFRDVHPTDDPPDVLHPLAGL